LLYENANINVKGVKNMTENNKLLQHIGTVRIIPYSAGKMIPEVTEHGYLHIDIYRTKTNVTLVLTDYQKNEPILIATLDDDNCTNLTKLIRRAVRFEFKEN